LGKVFLIENPSKIISTQIEPVNFPRNDRKEITSVPLKHFEEIFISLKY